MKWSVKPCFPHHLSSDFPAGETWTTYLAPMRWGQWDELIGLKGESLEILLMLRSKSGGKTSWGWQFIPLFTRFYTSQVVVSDFFHQQYQFQKLTWYNGKSPLLIGDTSSFMVGFLLSSFPGCKYHVHSPKTNGWTSTKIHDLDKEFPFDYPDLWWAFWFSGVY